MRACRRDTFTSWMTTSARGQYGVVDHVTRFEYDGNVGYGLHEHAFIGVFEKCGLRDGASGAE